ncbi:hypothetical protein M8J76_003509 [Diaphorina citri]|nr:hypothetical protein M8J76_003509 [Diaphorina citri]
MVSRNRAFIKLFSPPEPQNEEDQSNSVTGGLKSGSFPDSTNKTGPQKSQIFTMEDLCTRSLLLLLVATHLGLCADANLHEKITNLAEKNPNLDEKNPNLIRHKRDLYKPSGEVDDAMRAQLRQEALALKTEDPFDFLPQTTEWEPILYRFTTESSAEIARQATLMKEISDFVQAYRYGTKTTPDTRPENPDDTWTLGRPKFKGDYVGKPFHDPPWRIDELKYLHCHIDDCKAWFNKSDYKSYVLHMYDHFFNQQNFYVTWPPYIDKQNFTCYKEGCHQMFEEPGDFFAHVHEHLIEENVTDRTLFTTERTVAMADFFSVPKTSTVPDRSPRKCYMCNATLYSRDSLDKHIIKHAFNGSFYFTPKRQTLPPPQCVICNIQFSSEDKHELHDKKVHPEPGKSPGEY